MVRAREEGYVGGRALSDGHAYPSAAMKSECSESGGAALFR
jgi:hypothetical protein